VTAKKVTKGLNSHIPVIVYNGTFVMDNVTEEILIANYFDDGIYDVFAIYSRKVSIRLYTLILTGLRSFLIFLKNAQKE